MIIALKHQDSLSGEQFTEQWEKVKCVRVFDPTSLPGTTDSTQTGGVVPRGFSRNEGIAPGANLAV